MSDYVPFNVWIVMFTIYKVYDIPKKILLQDNQSTIKMEINEENSCTGNYRHIDIKSFFALLL